MRKTSLLFILLLLAAPALASGQDITYAGGTVASVKAGAAGSLDLSSGTTLRFNSLGGSLEVPYAAIRSYHASSEVAVHLGVAPTIAVGLVAARKRNHFVRITYQDSNHVTQVAVFQVPNTMLRYLMPALESRAPQAHCTP